MLAPPVCVRGAVVAEEHWETLRFVGLLSGHFLAFA